MKHEVIQHFVNPSDHNIPLHWPLSVCAHPTRSKESTITGSMTGGILIQCFPFLATLYARLSTLLPDFLTPNPRTEHVATVIKNNEVCVSARAERAFPVLDAEAPRGVEGRALYRFTQRTPREA
jgi:hypothetical protein